MCEFLYDLLESYILKGCLFFGLISECNLLSEIRLFVFLFDDHLYTNFFKKLLNRKSENI